MNKGPTIEKKQFNVRVTTGLKRDAKTAAARLGWSNDELVDVALRVLFGTQDPVTKGKSRLAKEVARELSLSFNHPDHQPDQALAA